MWKGAALHLNNNPTSKKVKPSWHPRRGKESLQKSPASWLAPEAVALPIPVSEKRWAYSKNEVVPVKQYNREHPKSSIPEEKAPRRKYFKPASVENSEFRFNPAST